MTDEAARLALADALMDRARHGSGRHDDRVIMREAALALRVQSLGTQGSVATPQQVQEACAQVADRAAEAPREVTPGTMARMIAVSIRALIPPPPPALVAQREALEGALRIIESDECEWDRNQHKYVGVNPYTATVQKIRAALKATPATGGDE